MLRLQLLAFFSTCCAALTLAGTVPEAASAVRILFVGSSSTYWHDLPAAVARQVSGNLSTQPGQPVSAEIVGRSGSDIRVYVEPGFNRFEYGIRSGETFLGKIEKERYPLVVLQVVGSFITDPKNVTADGTTNAHAAAVRNYIAAIRAAGGEPVFYEMGWRKGPIEAEARTRILALARETGTRLYAPCSTAWARVMAERPDLNLKTPPDNAHPGQLGHFLNLACFTAALTGESPIGKLPRTIPVWPPAGPKPTDPESLAAENARIAAFIPDAYQAQMPAGMRRHQSLGLTLTLDEPTARYLETVAWESWLETQEKLKTSE